MAALLTDADLETTTERRLWSAIESGEVVNAAVEPEEDQRAVRAQLLAELLTTEHRPNGTRARALILSGAHITGTLDLSGLTLVCALTIGDSVFDEGVSLDNAQLPTLNLAGCTIPTLTARQLETRGDVLLVEIKAGAVNLSGARIGGGLAAQDAFVGPGADVVLRADGIDVHESAFLDRISAAGEVSLIGARIGGQFVLDGARCEHAGGDALSLDGIKVGADLFANELRCVGTVRLIGATISGELQMRSAVLVHEGGIALNGDGLVVSSFFAHRLQATGELRLLDAHVGNEIVFDGAELTNPEGNAIAADNLHVGTNLFCRQGFKMTGTLRLDRARIGVSFGARDARLINGGKLAIDAGGIQVGQHVFFGPDLVLEGDVELTMARIEGGLALGGATLSDSGVVRLNDTRVGVFADFQWPRAPARRPWYRRWTPQPPSPPDRPYRPEINGFRYERLEPGTDDVATRLDWIAHGEQAYVPQAYDQLAGAFRAAGREEDARDVMVAKQRRKRGQLRLPGRIWSRFLDVTVGFGYHTGRAVFGLIAVMAVGWPVFAWASWDHLRPLKDAKQLPQFEPWLYSMDAVLPVITFGQETAWGATGFALYWYTFSVLAGWILGTALIAALTAMLNRT